MNNWNDPINNASKITWAEYFFDCPYCENGISKNLFFLNAFYSDIKDSDRDKVVNLLKKDEVLITRFRNLTKYFSNLIPNAAFNCPGFSVNGPKPLLTIGRVKAVDGRFDSSIIVVVYYKIKKRYNVPEGFHIYAKELGEDADQFITLFNDTDQYDNLDRQFRYKRLNQVVQFNNRNEPIPLSSPYQEALDSIGVGA